MTPTKIIQPGPGSLFLLLLVCITSCETAQIAKSDFSPVSQLSSIQNNCERSANMPQKLRMDNYRAPTPDCVPGGITVDTAEMQQLLKQSLKPVLIDVLSVALRPNSDFGETKWIPSKERRSLPGSRWLPNVGYGYLDAEMLHYFKTQLLRLTDGDKHRALVFFCIADCWMSWNAVQRAHDFGYTQLYWYKNGTDGWQENGLVTQIIEPEPLTD